MALVTGWSKDGTSISEISVGVGETVTVNANLGREFEYFRDTMSTADTSVATASWAGIGSGWTAVVTITGVSAGTTETALVGGHDTQESPLTIIVLSAEDESYLNKRGLTHFWENIDDIKQNKLTAGAGISITNDVISATGGGVADSVAWGHITGTMADQTDLTTALNAKANTADLAAVATSGSYNDLSNKPTIPGGTITGVSVNNTSIATSGVANIPLVSRNLDGAVPRTNAVGGAYDGYVFGIDADTAKWMKLSYNSLSNTPTIPSLTRRTSTSTPATVGSLVLGGNGTSTLPYAFPTIVGTNDESFWSYIRTTDITSGISEAYLGAYEYDPTENWWSGKKEARLALYSDIPTVGNATLTIQKNGASAGTFTANATSNKTINITVPTSAADVSALPASTKYGASIAVSINTTDYKVTTTLKDQDGNTLGTAQVIDLPLESVVVNGSYDSTNKKIVLTLQSGSTIDIPVGDLIAGLQSEITSTNKLASDLVDDTNQTHKFMTSAEKTKLSGIAAGAEVNVQSDWNQTTTTADDYIKNKPTKVSDFTNDAGYITSYTDTQVTQTRVDPSEITTFYPVASTTSYTNTGDVKKFGAVKLKYASDDGGTAELELGQNSYNDPVGGALTLWNMGSSQYKTTLQRSLGASNQTFYFPYNADSTSGTLIANGAATAGTGSATNPVYADRYGILHATTYALNKTVPSDAVFTDTTYSDATTSAAGLMSASDKTKLNGIASGAEVNVQSDWNVTSTSSDAFIKNKPTIPTTTSQLTNDSGFITDAGVTSFNGSTGAVTYTAPVTSVNGATGAVTGLQTTSNLVTSVSSSSTNAQYPSAKLFYDTIGDVESVLQTLNSGSGAA